MANLNSVHLIGRLCRDPEIRTFADGGAVVSFSFAVNNRRKNQASGEWEDEPVFLDMKAFNRGNYKLAEIINENLRKGQRVFIDGHLTLEKWTDKQDGKERQKLKIIVDNFQYLEKRDDAQQGRQSAPAAAAGAAAPSEASGPSPFGWGAAEPDSEIPF